MDDKSDDNSSQSDEDKTVEVTDSLLSGDGTRIPSVAEIEQWQTHPALLNRCLSELTQYIELKVPGDSTTTRDIELLAKWVDGDKRSMVARALMDCP